MGENAKPHIVNLMVGGAQCSGKTSLIRRITNNEFSKKYNPTQFLDTFVHTMTVDGNAIKVVFMDTDGEKKYENYSVNYYSTNDAVIIVYDVRNQESIEDAKSICSRASRYMRNPCAILVGNMCDEKAKINIEEVKAYANKKNFLHIETSAKTDMNVTEMLTMIIKEVFERKKSGPPLGRRQDSSDDEEFDSKPYTVRRSSPENEKCITCAII